MAKNRHIDKICAVITIISLILTILFINGTSLGIVEAEHVMRYENRLFDNTKVHTIDIVMDDWEEFIETCTDEEYHICNIVIDGEVYKNVGIRAKGNTSLSSVAAYENDRYSFKIEFDQYSDGNTYYGLDKLSLNNIIQDNTYLKDYLCYTMMNEIGIPSSLCSFVYITVNGEDWGLYLAVEGVEEGFLERNYGTNYGELYKPDSMNFGGGGPGNGQDFNMGDFQNENEFFENNFSENAAENDNFAATVPDAGHTFERSQTVEGQENQGEMPEGFPPDSMSENTGEMPEGFPPGGMGENAGEMPEGLNPGNRNENMAEATPGDFDSNKLERNMGEAPGNGNFEEGGMGSDDVKLQYIDDDPESYQNIFENAKTDITEEDKERLITSLKTLSESEEIESVVDVEAVMKYLVVHNFVCNEDSYTGTMVHNYYLYEKDGILSMIPWDYNLAFGGFSMGGGMGGNSSGATSQVNSPIDSPVSDGDISSRPMIAWIFEDEKYMQMYHEYYQEFISEYFESGYFGEMIDQVIALISPYVEKDPTAFCTYEEFEKGTQTLKEFCILRAESVAGQLDGTIPSTSEEQAEDRSALIDASDLSLSDMGSMNGGMGGEGGRGDKREQTMDMERDDIKETETEETIVTSETEQTLQEQQTSETEQISQEQQTSEIQSSVRQEEEKNDVSHATAADAGEMALQASASVSGDRMPEWEDTENRDSNRNFSPLTDDQAMQSNSNTQKEQMIWVGISGVILVIGILFAEKIKQR